MPGHEWYGAADVDALVDGILDLRETFVAGTRDWEVERIDEILRDAGVLGVLDDDEEE